MGLGFNLWLLFVCLRSELIFDENIESYRKEGKDSEYENVETEDDEDVEARKEQEEIRKFEEEEKRLMAKGLARNII